MAVAEDEKHGGRKGRAEEQKVTKSSSRVTSGEAIFIKRCEVDPSRVLEWPSIIAAVESCVTLESADRCSNTLFNAACALPSQRVKLSKERAKCHSPVRPLTNP
jgi:hypothetical protein